jgi:hypothetical protein
MSGERGMRYEQASFTLPACETRGMTKLEWDLRVGKITQAEFDALQNKAKVELQL